MVLKGEQPDYINAVSINVCVAKTFIIITMLILLLCSQGYKHKRAFIIAQGPMQNTIRNFWKMIYDRKCAVVVMVSGLVEGGEETSAQYWPDSGMAQFGEFIVDQLGEETLEGFTIRSLSVMDKRVYISMAITLV